MLEQTKQTMQVLGGVLQKTMVPGEAGPAYDSALLHYNLTFVTRPQPKMQSASTASAALEGQISHPDPGDLPAQLQVGGANVSVQLCTHSSTGDVLCAYGGILCSFVNVFIICLQRLFSTSRYILKQILLRLLLWKSSLHL